MPTVHFIQIIAVHIKKLQLVLKLNNHVIFDTANMVCEPPHDKTNKMTVRPAKTKISLGICPVWSESTLCAQWVAKDPSFLRADSEDSDQTGRLPRLIWVFAGRTVILLVLSWGGSYFFDQLLTSVRNDIVTITLTWFGKSDFLQDKIEFYYIQISEILTNIY